MLWWTLRQLRVAIAKVLGTKSDARAVPALIKAMSLKKPGYRSTNAAQEAQHAIVKLGASAVPALLAVVDSSEGQFGELVVRALGEIGDKRAIPALVRIFNAEADKFRDVKGKRDFTRGALEKLGWKADTAAPPQPRSTPATPPKATPPSSLAAIPRAAPAPAAPQKSSGDGPVSVSEFTYQILSDESVTKLAEKGNRFRPGEGKAILIKFSEPVAGVVARRRSSATLDGLIGCICGTQYPFKTHYQFSGGGPKSCPSCGKQTHIGVYYGSRAPGAKDDELLLTLITNDRLLTTIQITDVAGAQAPRAPSAPPPPRLGAVSRAAPAPLATEKSRGEGPPLAKTLRVGERFDRSLPGQEGAYYQYGNDGHEMFLFFSNLKPEETETVQSGRAEFGLLTLPPFILFLCYRFDGKKSVGWGDAPYNWHIQEIGLVPAMSEANNGILLPITLIETPSRIVRAIRSIRLSPQFSSALTTAITQQAAMPKPTGLQYKIAIDRAYQQYPNTDSMRPHFAAHFIEEIAPKTASQQVVVDLRSSEKRKAATAAKSDGRCPACGMNNYDWVDKCGRCGAALQQVVVDLRSTEEREAATADCWTYPTLASQARESSRRIAADILQVLDRLETASVEQIADAFQKSIDHQGIPNERERWIRGPSDRVVDWVASKVTAASEKAGFTSWKADIFSVAYLSPGFPLATVRIHRPGEFSFCLIGKSNQGELCALNAFHPKFF